MNKINDNLYTFEGQQDIVSPQLVYYPAIIRENIRKMIDIAGGAARLWPHIKTHKSFPFGTAYRCRFPGDGTKNDAPPFIYLHTDVFGCYRTVAVQPAR